MKKLPADAKIILLEDPDPYTGVKWMGRWRRVYMDCGFCYIRVKGDNVSVTIL